MVQTSGFDSKNKVKACFECKMFDVANWVARHLKENWRYPQSFDILLPWSETISFHPEWGQKRSEGSGVHTKDHSIQISEQDSIIGLWLDRGEKTIYKCSITEGGIPGPKTFQGSVSESDCW